MCGAGVQGGKGGCCVLLWSLQAGGCEGKNQGRRRKGLILPRLGIGISDMVLWPSGLRRWSKVPVRKSQGSTPCSARLFSLL